MEVRSGPKVEEPVVSENVRFPVQVTGPTTFRCRFPEDVVVIPGDLYCNGGDGGTKVFWSVDEIGHFQGNYLGACPWDAFKPRVVKGLKITMSIVGGRGNVTLGCLGFVPQWT
jgi:hypothetical protein